METNFPPSILPHNRPTMQDPLPQSSITTPPWPLTSPPLHNTRAQLAENVRLLRAIQRGRKDPVSTDDRTQIKALADRLERQMAQDRHDKHLGQVEECRKRMFDDIEMYEDAVEAHAQTVARQSRLEVELAETRLEAEAALAHCAKIKKMIWTK